MHNILVMGAGKIGSFVAISLAHSKDYRVFLGDNHVNNIPLKSLIDKTPHLKLIELHAGNTKEIIQFLKENAIQAIVSCLPYHHVLGFAKIAIELNIHYFDLTEDVNTTTVGIDLAKNLASAFVPQCGLAPGFISIIAHHLMKDFPELDMVKLRVGALPINISNALQYSLLWSTDGLINEYGNLCHAIENGGKVTLLPLDDLEEIKIDGLTYEAFNTSGGIGTLVNTYLGKVKHLSYKTIRYPGHCAKMHFLMYDLQLNNSRDTLKQILENALPKTSQDVVLVYVSVTGTLNNQFYEENYVKKFYPKEFYGVMWSAIQLTTSFELCAVIDIVLNNPEKYRGFVRQEQFSLEMLTQNRFGQYFA